MQTTLDCLPCLLQQALYAVRLTTPDREVQQQLMIRAARYLSRIDLHRSPPENAVALYGMVSEVSGVRDPFLALKRASTLLARNLEQQARQRIKRSDDPLITAIRYAIAGNIIDYGAHHRFEAEKTIAACLSCDFAVDHSPAFKEDLERVAAGSGVLLYLADNCGELVFDGLLLEVLAARGMEIFVAVKEQPIINDALMEDALAGGLDAFATVISNGTGCPGTPLADCSPRFQEIFNRADLIVSKGQGNFETLSGVAAPLYFLLTIKCGVAGRLVAEKGGLPHPLAGLGEMVLLK